VLADTITESDAQAAALARLCELAVLAGDSDRAGRYRPGYSS